MLRLLCCYLLLVLSLAACTSKPDHHRASDAAPSDDPNQALYNEVMAVHDEAMPQMDVLYRMKVALQDRIAQTATMTDEEKKALEKRIAALDSTNNLMMVWMREFQPLPDSTDQEAARAYLESEMEKIKKVREAMFDLAEREKAAGN